MALFRKLSKKHNMLILGYLVSDLSVPPTHLTVAKYVNKTISPTPLYWIDWSYPHPSRDLPQAHNTVFTGFVIERNVITGWWVVESIFII